MERFFAGLCLAVSLIFSTGVQPAGASTAALPIRLDYSLLRAFFVNQAFTEPDETAVVIDEHEGCQLLKLQHPEIYSDHGGLRLKADVALKIGLPLLDDCRMPFGLEGRIDVLLRVHLDAADWALRFQAEDLRFTTLEGKSSVVSAQVLDLVRERLFGHLDQVVVNLATPVQELRAMLPLFFEDAAQARMSKWLQGIRPGRIEAQPGFYSVELLMEVDADQMAAGPSTSPERHLSPEEMEQFVRRWEGLDAFLVSQISNLGQFGLDDQERAEIMQILISARYQFLAAVASDQADTSQDLVRKQFLSAWERLAPLFRKYLARDPSTEPLSSLLYLSAGDLLAAMDTLGPAMGVEISRDGLIRLARLLAGDSGAVNLDYSFDVDPVLRKMLGFGPPLAVPEQILPSDDVDIESINGGEGRAEKSGWFRPATWFDLSPRAAFAADPSLADLQALKPWLVDVANFEAYQQRVRAMLQAEAKQVVDNGKLSADRRALFEKILQATAWQESCFRQFQVKNGKITYLRSWNNTSVGLMQINERVWRGLYRIDALRWDPRYNIQAGSEILRMYLSDYALKKAKGSLANDDDLARATYALYNSGPQNFASFLARHAGRNYGQSDALFWDKFVLAKAEEFDRLKSCLFGE